MVCRYGQYSLNGSLGTVAAFFAASLKSDKRVSESLRHAFASINALANASLRSAGLRYGTFCSEFLAAGRAFVSERDFVFVFFISRIKTLQRTDEKQIRNKPRLRFRCQNER